MITSFSVTNKPMITKNDSSGDEIKLGVSSAEAESKIREESVVPVSPSECNEESAHKSDKFTFGFLFCNETHSSGLFFWETNFYVVGHVVAEDVVVQLVHLLFDYLY